MKPAHRAHETFNFSKMHVNILHICYALFPSPVTSPTITHFTIVLHLATESSNYQILPYPETSTLYSHIQEHPRSPVLQLIYISINKMSQVPQSQPVFVDIPTNNGRKVGNGTFKNILKGRFNETKMQLAFEQYLGDIKTYGPAYRTYRYEIVDENMLMLRDVLNPFQAGPALAAPVTQPSLQNANGQTQSSGYQTPYASQLNQPVSNFLGPIDPSEVRNIRYPSARTTQKSTPQSRQWNPRAVDFKVSSTVNNLSKSAPPSGWPTARKAPTRPPGLPGIPQPQLVPSNAHQGFFTPDAPSNARERYIHPDIIPSAPPLAMPKANTAPARPPGLPETQQPHLAPANAHRGFFTPDAPLNAYQCHDFTDITRMSISANSPLPPYSLPVPPKPQIVPRDPHRGILKLDTCFGLFDFNATQDSLISPSPLDLNANSSSTPNYPPPPPPQSSRRSSEHYSDTPSYSSSDEPKSPGRLGLEHGVRLPLPVRKVSKSRSFFRTFDSSASGKNTTNNNSQGPQNGEADPAPRDPSSDLASYVNETPYSSESFYKWWISARPSSRLHYLRHFGYVGTECQCEYNSRHPHGRANTVSHRTNPPAVVNGTNAPRRLAEVAMGRTVEWLISGVAARIANEAGENSSPAPQPPVEAQPEAQSSGVEEEVDPDLQQRLDGHSLTLTDLVDEICGIMIDVEARLD